MQNTQFNPWVGSSHGERTGYPLQYSWASLMTQIVKNLPAIKETWVWSLDWQGPLEKGMATQSSILAWRIPTDRGAWRATVHGVAESRTRLSDWAEHSKGRSSPHLLRSEPPASFHLSEPRAPAVRSSPRSYKSENQSLKERSHYS